jgi:hypothetical protein
MSRTKLISISPSKHLFPPFAFLERRRSGVDVMITIFGEKIGVFLKNHCYDQFFFKKLALFCVKNANFFRRIFRRKYLKNHNIGPCLERKIEASVTRLGEFSPFGRLLFWAYF